MTRESALAREQCAAELTPILAAARAQEKELAALKEPIVRSLNELHPLYYVRHPDDSYSVADPQPTEMPVNLSWPPVVSYSAGAPAGTVSSLEESHGFVTAVPDPQGRTIASGAAHTAYMMNKAREEEQHSADLREVAEMAIAECDYTAKVVKPWPTADSIVREFREKQKKAVTHNTTCSKQANGIQCTCGAEKKAKVKNEI